MFTPTKLQFIRKKSPTDFDALLSRLAIAIDNTIDDEDKLYEKIDDDLTRKLSALMKSPSVIAGYTTLLKLGGVAYDYSQTDNELLAKIVANKSKIQRGFENLPKFVEVEVDVPAAEPQPIQQPSTQTKMRTVTHEEHRTLPGPIILGIVLIVAGAVAAFIFDSTIGGIIAALLGIASIVAGVRGKTIRTTETVSVVEKIPVPQNVNQPARKKIVRKEAKMSFTPNELQKIFDVLTQLNKIVRAI